MRNLNDLRSTLNYPTYAETPDVNAIIGKARRQRASRRLSLATSALAAAAVAAVAISTGGLGIGRGTDGSSALPGTVSPGAQGLSPVAQTLELTAANAAAKPFTPPRPDQWIYIQNRKLATGSIEKDKNKGQKVDVTYQTWKRADGKKMAEFNPETGKLDTWDQTHQNTWDQTDFNEYPTLSTLPTDPQELLTVLRKSLEAEANPSPVAGQPQPPRAIIASSPDEWNGLLFRKIASILDRYLLPPDVTAALWRAAALIPGVTQSTVEVNGRQVTAVGRVLESWQFDQLLLDPDTHDFVGYRSVAVKDYTFTSPNGPITIEKGEAQFETIRLAAKIVDAAGQTS